MLRFRCPKAIQLAAVLISALTAACSSGGGGGGGSPTASTPAVSPSTTSAASPAGGASASSPVSDATDTGIAGGIGTPGSGLFGSAAAQLAAPSGPTFDGSSGSYPKNAIFPLLSASLQKTPTGLSAAATDQDATATVVSTSASASTMQLTIPSLGIDQTLTFNTNLVSHLGQVTDGLSYVVMGAWIQRATAGPMPIQSQTAFVFGYETPSAAMPATGTAAFAATPGSATAYIYKPVNGEIQSAYAEGNAAFTVNFASGQVTGSINNMQLLNTKQPWNDVSVSASIVTGTNRFGGTTAAVTAPGMSMSLSGSASGRIDGGFFGPAAQNLAAVWSLSDGTGSALGTIVVGH